MSFIGRCIGDCLYGTVSDLPTNPPARIPASKPIPDVILDSSCMGQEAVVVKNGSRLCGSGSVRASLPIRQSKAYWEIKIQQNGKWSAGLCTHTADLKHNLGQSCTSWAINQSGIVTHNKEIIYSWKNADQEIAEGDILGFSYDHVELNFYLNGVNLNFPVLGIKGTVFPALFVDDGAILDAIFENFRYPPPPNFDRILVEKALL